MYLMCTEREIFQTTNQTAAFDAFDDLNNARMTQWKSINGTFQDS